MAVEIASHNSVAIFFFQSAVASAWLSYFNLGDSDAENMPIQEEKKVHKQPSFTLEMQRLIVPWRIHREVCC